MIEDELLKWRFKRGSQEALRRIYEKYLNYLLTLAMGLLNNAGAAEDIVHDVFVAFAQSAKYFKLRGSLKSYLATCVVNRVRDLTRRNQRLSAHFDEVSLSKTNLNTPYESVVCTEEAQRLNHAVAQLPLEQRETLTLHLKGEMKFKEIARLQGVSVNTVQGRYRYGLNKLRSILNGEVEK